MFNEMFQDAFQEEYSFLASLAHAKENGLDLEWVSTFLSDFRQTGDIRASIQHANREWDL